MNQVNSSELSYRAEIDGLRAIAVVSVILYHAQMVLFGRDWFEGGYIGVDIFFVISGYLITRIILSELESKGSFSFLNFYERRARRILPMLFVVIFVSVPYAWQKLLPSDFVEYAESILASLFFGSNFFFYFSTTEYGADSALLKPFLHTWSLGVEEQFYLVFPILAIVAFKYFRKHFLTTLVGLSLLSLQFAELMEVRNSDLNFYLPFSRFWELAVGSMLAYRELIYKPSNENFASKSLPMIGMYLIAYSILFFDAKTPHPSFRTLIPIIGVALIIGFASKDELVGKVLGSKPFVWVGLISYSAYLWHFPIFAFSRMGKEPTNYDKFEWLALTALLSVMSFFLVEKPFRSSPKVNKKAFLVIAFFAFLMTLLLLSIVILKDGFKQRFPKPNFVENYEMDKKKLGRNTWDYLHNAKKDVDWSKTSKLKVLIVGDSHSRDIFNALHLNRGLLSNVSLYRISDNAHDEEISCFDESVPHFADVRSKFYSNQYYAQADVVIVSNSWNANKCRLERRDFPKINDMDGLPYLIARVKKDGKGFILFDQSPIFGKISKKSIIDYVVNKRIDEWKKNPSLSISTADLATEVGTELYKRKKNLDKKNQRLRDIANSYSVPFINRGSVICSDSDRICDGLTSEGFRTFLDESHYSLDGARHFGYRLITETLLLRYLR